ncbi:hypothetical protein C445_16929 [Halobiforma lacisalsi AJ5]|uniref:Uncharacterized protein n=1 Tax=Natronobacterium lacisalsi AJ5 TaxID=358396 RepID=M0LDJ5_NATLA|nr:hypothetical protein C445_16929 [Halobiforma lacisalsi AJ5]
MNFVGNLLFYFFKCFFKLVYISLSGFKLHFRDKPCDRIQVYTDRFHAESRCFNQRGSSSHKGVENFLILNPDIFSVKIPERFGIIHRYLRYCLNEVILAETIVTERLIFTWIIHIYPLRGSPVVEERVECNSTKKASWATCPPFMHRVYRPVMLLGQPLFLSDFVHPLNREATFDREFRTTFLSWLLLRHLISFHFHERHINLVLRLPVTDEVGIRQWWYCCQ